MRTLRFYVIADQLVRDDVCYLVGTMNWMLGDLGPGESREVVAPALVNGDNRIDLIDF